MSALNFLKTAAGITTMWGLAGVAIWALLQISSKQRGKVPPIAWAIVAAIVIVALVPTLGWVQLEREKTHDNATAIYRVRVTVLNPQQQPVNDAKVTSSMNAIAKKVDGGYEFEIPAATKPSDGILTIYATVESAFWSGKTDVQLTSEFNPNITVQLAAGVNAQVRGIVQDQAGRALAGATVSVVGYGSEAFTTKSDGNFTLPAHAADGQQVQLHAEKPGYEAANLDHPAGRLPATLVLEKDGKK
jgi:hypothetical protein